MLIYQSMEMLRRIRLNAFAQALEDQEKTGGFKDMSFIDRISLLIQAEILHRDNKAIKRKIYNAKLKEKAFAENVKTGRDRGIDTSQLQALITCDWIKRKQNIIITGPTGAGKSYLASALVEKSCRLKFDAQYLRYHKLKSEMELAILGGQFHQYLNKMEKLHLLVIDDWALHAITESEQKNLFEIIETRNKIASTIFISQTPVSNWHSLMPNSVIADAILDRIVHTAIRIELSGESIRKEEGLKVDLGQ